MRNEVQLDKIFYKILIVFVIKIVFSYAQTNNNNNDIYKKPRRVCYFANWAPYRGLKPALYPDSIDPELCTHIHYAFAKIDPDTLSLLPTEEHDINWTRSTKMPLYIRLYGLKRRNVDLKILLAVGGWSMRSDGFNMATRTKQNRTKFINQTLSFLREWNFDGVDLDWEFPGDQNRDADVDSKENFNHLVTEIRTAIDIEKKLSGKRALLVTSAVAADPKKINEGYYVKNLCHQLDYISVMTYDYHGGTWDDRTGLNSPLYSRDAGNGIKDDSTIAKWKNANFSISYWISNGCAPEKINLGLAAYGRSFTLKNASHNKVGAPALKGGLAGSYTKEEGIYSYFEICEKINVEIWKKSWDQKQQSAYASHGDQWVGYDNERSIALKVHWALTVMSLGGTMLWTLDFDDYSGKFCGGGKFPLANAIKSVFDEYSLENESFTKNLTTERVKSTTTKTSSSSYDLVEKTLILTDLTTRTKTTTISTPFSKNKTSTIQKTVDKIKKLPNTFKTFFLPVDPGDQKLLEKEKLNGVMYEILNAPLLASSNTIHSNLSNDTVIHLVFLQNNSTGQHLNIDSLFIIITMYSYYVSLNFLM